MIKYATISLIVLLWVFACNPVKKVMNDPDKKEEVSKRLLKEGICRPDTFLLVITDTVVTTDTVEHLYLTTDTIVNMDTVYITKTRWKDIIKTVTIRDTLLKTIEDRTQVNALKDDVMVVKARLSQQKEKDAKTMLWLAIIAFIFGAVVALLIRR